MFEDLDVFRNFLQIFGHWKNTYLAEHILMAASTSSSFVNVSTSQFLDRTKNGIIILIHNNIRKQKIFEIKYQ